MKSQLLEPPVPAELDRDDRERDDVRLGGGGCTQCHCSYFEGNTYTCANETCGHPWADHSA